MVVLETGEVANDRFVSSGTLAYVEWAKHSLGSNQPLLVRRAGAPRSVKSGNVVPPAVSYRRFAGHSQGATKAPRPVLALPGCVRGVRTVVRGRAKEAGRRDFGLGR